MIKNRNEACLILGISFTAGESEVKSSYKRLVKIYHPDAGLSTDTNKYRKIVEAYNFLLANPYVAPKIMNVTATPQPKVLGNTANNYYKKSNYYSDFEKKYQKQVSQNKIDFEKKMEEHEAKLQKEAEDYKKAMDAINSIRLAEAIRQLLGRK